MNFHEFLQSTIAAEGLTTDDILASFLPLAREVIEAHRTGAVAPLEGLNELKVEGSRIWFEEAKRQPVRNNISAVQHLEVTNYAAIEVVEEARRTTDLTEGGEQLVRSEIGVRGEPITRPVYLPGYVAWEHELQHQDPLTDIHSLGLILASLACGLNLAEPTDLDKFVSHRRNLFALNPQLHPVLARAVLRMTELDRRRRPQDLPALLHNLENYRDQQVDFDLDLARVPGFQSRDRKTKQQVVLSKLRDRLFDLSKRNNLLHFRPTMQSVNLTQASIPLLLDVRNIREDKLLLADEGLRQRIVEGKPISLNKYLNFAEALYLPSLLERIMADARRDQNEYGFAQLRLVICFLSWANLKEKPIEQFVSPLVLLPVRLTKIKGIRDTFQLEPLSSEAEVNPVLRHQFRCLYNITLPETIDLATGGLNSLYEFLAGKIQASEPAVTVNRLDRPRIDLIHEKAKRRLDQYRRTARLAGRGVRNFLDHDYSYDAANFHPLGIKLFSALVRTPGHQLRSIIEERPRARTYMTGEPVAPNVVEKERTFFQLRETADENPYTWNFDLCNVTLANFHYRRMSLVRDYEAIQERDLTNAAFDSTFSLTPRPVGRTLPVLPALDDRFDVVPCDPTQATAIAEARGGGCYIIQGPPGTGKSQTITNLIADFVARGQRVLFVCEKRAAIDVVYARLKQTGLGSLGCLIHDSQTDKKEFILDLKQTYESLIAAVEGAPTINSRQARDALLQRMHANLSPLEHFDETMQSSPASIGQGVREFLDHCLSIGHFQPNVTPEEAERLPLFGVWAEHGERIRAIEPSIAELEPHGIWAKHPLRLLSPKLARIDRPIEQVTEGASEAQHSLRQLIVTLKQCDIESESWENLGRVRELLAYFNDIAPLAQNGNVSLADTKCVRTKQFTGTLQRLQQLEDEFTQAQQANANWREKLSAMDVQTAWEQSRQFTQQAMPWLSLSWWRLRTVLKRCYNFQAHAIQPSWTEVLSLLKREYEAITAIDKATAEAKLQFQLDRSPRDVEKVVRRVHQRVANLPGWLRAIHQALLKSTTADSTVEQVLAAEPIAKELCQTLDEFATSYEQVSLEQLNTDLTGMLSAVRQVPRALQVLAELGKLPGAVNDLIRNASWTIPQAEAAVARRSWEALCQGDRELNQFNGALQARCVQQLEQQYDNWLAANATEIMTRVKQQFLDNLRITNLPIGQLTTEQREFKKGYTQGRRTLEHEFGKTMRYKSIRELVDGDSGLVVRDLKPVWLMSPLSVSDTLPLTADFFDVVIFDEASQVTLEEAVPSIFRGGQVIVVGDEMQLPPTDFFAAKSSREEDEDEAMIEVSGEQVRYDLQSDSFLSHAAKNLPSTMLGWHYRSRSESLISFSNWAFYDGRLLTVPDVRLSLPAPPSSDKNGRSSPADRGLEHLLANPLSFHFLSDGLYDNRRNRPEADYIASMVRDLLKRKLRLSIAVIAFSEAQQEEIESALHRLTLDDDEFRQLYEEELQREVDDQFVGLLVKNLENIQGDERDVVIMSICYGRGPTGKMLMNFGPINKSGGEKRLNVAFSRAKQYMAVVSSIQYSQITNDYNEGANCLRNYLRYVEAVSRGDITSARRVLTTISRWRESSSTVPRISKDTVCQQLSDELVARGYRVETGVGQSHFRVDLAVHQSGDEKYRLGILIDTVEHYEHSTPLERDLMRPRLLRGFGWNVMTVLAKDWLENREVTIAGVIARIDAESKSINLTTDVGGPNEIGTLARE